MTANASANVPTIENVPANVSANVSANMSANVSENASANVTANVSTIKKGNKTSKSKKALLIDYNLDAALMPIHHITKEKQK